MHIYIYIYIIHVYVYYIYTDRFQTLEHPKYVNIKYVHLHF